MGVGTKVPATVFQRLVLVFLEPGKGGGKCQNSLFFAVFLKWPWDACA
jgi:hypothetical protein